MPIVVDASGRFSYIPAADYFHIGPEYFFRGNDDEYVKRVAEARYRVLRAISTTGKPLTGRGTCHEITISLATDPDETRHGHVARLVDYVDAKDGNRARRVRKQRSRRSSGGPARNAGLVRSPQDIKRRRSALFGGTDIPLDYIKMHRLTQTDVNLLVELMRWHLVEDAILEMYSDEELVLIDCTWYVSVQTMDTYRHTSHPRHLKNDRSWHGRANNKRDGFPAQTVT